MCLIVGCELDLLQSRKWGEKKTDAGEGMTITKWEKEFALLTFCNFNM